MSLLALLWANLFRKPTRTCLTLASVAIAFLLFVLLRSISAAFDSGLDIASAERLMVIPKYSQTDALPYAQRQQIAAIEGVENVSHTLWFGGNYQDPKNFFAKYPVDPLSYFAAYPELEVQPEGALARFANQRTAAVVDVGLAEKYGWQVGQVIPIQGTIYAKNDGSRLWEFELVGTFSENGESSSFPLFLFHYDFFREAAAFGGDSVGTWVLNLSDPALADEVAQQIDTLFTNSSDPTKTATEDEYSRMFARQLGDMGFITTVIMAAVFFTIILLTGNTMMQALRERIPELAVLKTLGFANSAVSLIVLGEAILLCLVGAAIGVVGGFALGPFLSKALAGVFGQFAILPSSAIEALMLGALIGLVIGVVPAFTAQKLTIVEALRRS